MLRVSLCLCLCLTASAEEGLLTFEKISRYRRSAEPVAFGMPWPAGALREAGQFALFDQDRALPVQTTSTGKWPDGSVRWLFVRTLVDLPGNAGKQILWRTGGSRASGSRELAKTLPDGSVSVHTGPLEAIIPARGFFPLQDVRLNGRLVWQQMSGFAIRAGGRNFATAEAGPVKLEVRESGPVAAVVRVSGRHGGAGSPFDFSAELTFWAGKAYVTVDYRVLLARGTGEQSIDAWDWNAPAPTPAARGVPQLRMGQGHYRSAIRQGTEPLSFRFGLEEFRFHSVEHAFQSYWGDFWCDWTSAGGGLAVTLRQAQQNFPKAMEALPGQLTVSLYPAQKEPLWFPLGGAKAHQMMLHFHPADTPVEELSRRSLQYQIPDIPLAEASWYGRSQVWDDRMFDAPPGRRIEAIIYDVLDNRPVGMGIWNFGDEVDWGYTGQGRGRDDVVWLNNEYDFTHHLFLQYARSSERRFLDYAFANARHWRDVDIAHVSSEDRRRGGHIAHSPRHVTGGVGPSHQWVEGLIDAYHFFGDEDAWRAALGIGDNILRTLEAPQYRDPARSSTRDMGWAMRAMLALYRETGDRKYLEACQPIVALFKHWHALYPGLIEPYTDHSLVRVLFMKSLTLVSLARYYRYVPDESIRTLVLAETDDLLRHGRNRNGLFYYKELPSLKHQGATCLVLQLLAEAYRLSGDRKYLEAGLPELEYQLVNLNARFEIHTGASEKFAHSGGGYARVLYYPAGGKYMGTNLGPILEFLDAARDPDLARQVDWALRLR